MDSKDMNFLKMIQEPQAEASGCSETSTCGSSGGPADMDPEVWNKVKNHPCYSEEAHHFYARMHVAVAPACNIQCNYCNRKYDCSNESRPGVVSERLTPELAAKKVLAVASEIHQMTVVGIAGAGDSLANPDKTFKTFELISKAAPDIKLCLSTNGLALPDMVDRIADYNVDHVTVTINMVDPEVGEQIYPWIYFNKKRWRGRDAAKILSERQLLGLEMLTARKILVKVNSVMIPGINDEHLKDVNREVKKRGAFLHNIMPLISEPEHGTFYGLNGQRGPTAEELKHLQDSCEGEMNMMRHCRQCRADAVGLLGEDRSAEFTNEKIEAIEIADVQYDLAAREEYRDKVENIRETERKIKEMIVSGLGQNKDLEQAPPILIAVATQGGGEINQHFGHAREFQVYEVDANEAKFIGHRRVDLYCEGGFGEEDSLTRITEALSDCVAVMVAKIGGCPKKTLEEAHILGIDKFAFQSIKPSLLTYFKEYVEGVKSGAITPKEVTSQTKIRSGAYTAPAGSPITILS
ncbi:MAG: nitrogenase cofactor biosynthesis protein NifB [Leptospirillum sp.]|jgi:nitrogen fixation protein NifB|nr:nitrogenase cofactor biosynthesis protein NifB [Nitrospiraceae bacterium]